ncbi:hypothetical protein GGI23_003798 [Coemansia sp. RSA 2559]|nr:hypothetical protein GGI23_003798 [Coemansia sp. RSA 2559]KAJ2854823.1 hypothetical protein GGI22_004354 [Coemansia erecta]
MTVQTGREIAANGNIDRAGAASPGQNTAPAAISNKDSSKNARFPGVGRTLSGRTTDHNKEEAEEEEEPDNASESEAVGNDGQDGTDEGSDFDDEASYQSEDDDLDNEEEYSSDNDDDEDAARGGSSVYNLRSPALKRKLGSGDSDDEETPSLRTRQKTTVSYDESSEDNASGDNSNEN